MAPRQSYGAITIKHDQELESLVPQPAGTFDQKKKNGIIAILAVIAVAIAGVTYTYSGHGASTSRSHAGGGSKHFAPSSKGSDHDECVTLSDQSPVDMGFQSIKRASDALPSIIWGNRTGPLPTNIWYLNLVSHKASQQPDESTRAYTVPYIIDTAPPKKMGGIRVHWPVVSAGARNIQMVDDFKNALCLGSEEIGKSYNVNPNEALSHLGVSLVWNETSKGKSMVTNIVRGMPYATMHYFGGALPTLYSYNGPSGDDKAILADGHKKLVCGTMGSGGGRTVSVKKELDLHFINSDFTWGIFFSKSVQVKCEVSEGDEKTREFQLSVVSYEESEEPLTVRVSLLDQCTTGESDIKGHCGSNQVEKKEEYVKAIKEGASVFPTSSQIHFSYPEEDSDDRVVNMTIDWGAQTSDDSSNTNELLMFALPHHQDQLTASANATITKQCVSTFHGDTCLVRASVWKLAEDLGAPMSFNARRPPSADAIPTLANALAQDINYRLSDNLLRAAADTYFSGKILARVARVIEISSEMNALASGDVESLNYDDVDEESLLQSSEAAASENLPSEQEIADAVEQLKKGVQAWLSEGAEAPFVFDESWGGLVNCGCRYSGKGETGFCNNTFPDCPALGDVNEDFGNGYYNDHHYHYGYHIYAAAVVARHDPEWAEEYFDKVLLYIRDFANPSAADEYFIQFRQKDWFLGSSWASGIVSGENSPHGRNEESSSEAIAAYEGIALYGTVMTDVFSQSSPKGDELETARLVRDAGQLLTATEVRATNRFWHVWSSDDHKNTYPAAYTQPVVGMLYDTMASFQTWFAPQAVVSYGIQLMPFTAVTEQRDDPRWAAELYPLYVEACETAGDFCVNNGWSILQAGLCAEAGDKDEALEQILSVPAKVFDSQGGNGNSLSNTIWFIATRGTTVSTIDTSNTTLSASSVEPETP